MLCEKCKKNVATFHYTEVVNGVKNEHHLCSECAANTDVSYYSNVFDNNMQFTRLLSGILGSQGFLSDDEETDPATQVQCPNCKMKYGEFIKNSSFGCPECYDVFGPLITDKIKKIQGSDRHVGKKPMAYSEEGDKTPQEIQSISDARDIRREIEVLSRKLKDAVNLEDFDEAARLRDMIAGLKGKDGK